MASNDNLTDTGKFNAIQAAIQEVKELIIAVQDANNAADAAKAATRKSKTDELKKKHAGNYRPE